MRYETRLSLRWGHALAERMQFTLSTEGVETDDRDYIGITAGGNYQYTSEINLGANFRYRTQETDFIEADSSSVFFSLSYSPI